MERYKSKIDIKQIYDGDTIEKVMVTLIPKEHLKMNGLEFLQGHDPNVWPGMVMTLDGLTLEFSLRIDGIDAPEMKPEHHYLNGTPRTEESIEKEKALAVKSKNALIELIQKSDNEIYISNPQEGKYARRMVCTCEVKDGDDYIDVGKYLISKNLAKPYEGGTKSPWF